MERSAVRPRKIRDEHYIIDNLGATERLRLGMDVDKLVFLQEIERDPSGYEYPWGLHVALYKGDEEIPVTREEARRLTDSVLTILNKHNPELYREHIFGVKVTPGDPGLKKIAFGILNGDPFIEPGVYRYEDPEDS